MPWIVDYFPLGYEQMTYLEICVGSGATLFQKRPSILETINDLDDNVINLFKMIRTRGKELAELVRFTPYAREEYSQSYESGGGDDMERARRFLVRCWMAIGTKSSDRTGWRSVMNPKDPHPSEQWSNVPDRILLVAERLKNVQIERQPALELMDRYKRPDVLVYADPPYLLATRKGKRIYKHEMTDADHAALLEVLDGHPGPVLLSGYPHPLYDNRLKHWRRVTKLVKAEAGKQRTEVLWINPIAADRQRQGDLFDFKE